ncbi:hypothetical protein [Lysobacter xanthus]
MWRPDIFNRHRMPAALAAGAVLGLAAGALFPPPAATARVTPRHGWRVPGVEAVARVDEAEFARVRSAPIWGATAAGGDTVKAASWRLVGIMNIPQPVALVSAGSGPEVLQLKVGDPLPDGSALRSVDPNGLTFVRDGCAFERTLYSATDSPIDGSCAASQPAAAAKTPDQPAK